MKRRHILLILYFNTLYNLQITKICQVTSLSHQHSTYSICGGEDSQKQSSYGQVTKVVLQWGNQVAQRKYQLKDVRSHKHKDFLQQLSTYCLLKINKE